jgi:hypothetical protein
MSRIIYTGDTAPYTITIQTDGDPVAISQSAQVTAAIVAMDGSQLAGPWPVTEANGGNWAAGVVTVVTDGAQTKDLPAQMVRFEVQVVSGGTVITRQTTESITLRRAGIQVPT